jgi:hypothetical protein
MNFARQLYSRLQAGHGWDGTAFHSLAPKGRGWGEGVTMFPYRTAGAPSSHLLPAGEKE